MKTPVFLLCLIKNLNLKHESSCLLIIYCIFCLSFSWFFPLSWLSSGRGLDEIRTTPGWYTTLSFWTCNSSCHDYYGIFLSCFVSHCCHLAPLKKKKRLWQLIRAFYTLFCIIVHIFLFYRCLHTCELKAIGWLTGIYVDLWSRPGRKPVWKH